MELNPMYLDCLRALHLACFAAGMGTSLYFDFRTALTIGDPITPESVEGLQRIHNWILGAFMGLWITGTVLIYVRTGFELAAFSPKLWVKIGLMVLMTWNARKIATFVLPLLRNNIGRSMISVPLLQLTAATQAAVISIFCWTSGLLLGSSVMLKTAPWEVVVPLAAVWFVALTAGGHLAVSVQRARAASASDNQQQLAFDL